jgi:glycosyltransferase involved in cell wall biosynthesis
VRICIVTVAGHGIGGMQDHTRTLAAGLVAAGHEIEVVTTLHPEGLVAEVRDGARWNYVDAKHHHPWLPRRDPAWLPRSCEVFLRLHSERPFDVIHSESSSAIGLVRRGIHRRVPLVAEWHGSTLSLIGAALARARAGDSRARVREAKGFIWDVGEYFQYGHWYRFRPCVWMTPSRHEFENIRRDGCLKGALGHVVPNGVDAREFRPRAARETRAELGLADGPLFVCVGRLSHQKGMGYAILALAKLHGELPGARVVIVGEGEEREPLERLARSLGLERHVVFTGASPHEMVAKYLAAADVFLFPTERAEAAPLVLPQAMASGTPVVASDIGSIAEVVGRRGENGLLVPPGDVNALADATLRLMRDEALRRRIGESARRRVLAEYTVERMVERTLEVYRIAIARFWSGNRTSASAGPEDAGEHLRVADHR